MAEDIGSLVVRVAMDNSNFQQGIQNLNRSMKVIQSEFKNATVGLKDHGKGLDGLKAKQDMLSKSIDAQSKIVKSYEDKLKESKDTLKGTAKAQEDLKFRVALSKKEYEDSKKVLGENSDKTKELKNSYEKLNNEFATNEEKIRNNVRTMDNWTIKTNNAKSKLSEMQTALNKTNKEIDIQGSKWTNLSKKLETAQNNFKKVGDKLEGIGKGFTAKVSAPIAGLGIVAGKAAIDFESAFAGVKKTVSGTEKQFAQMEKGMRDMSKHLPTDATEIAHVAEAAGQLGIQTDNILSFSKTIIDLGNATNLVGEEGASQLAKFANITSMSQKNFDRLGSTIVDLGNNMATTEADIVAMGMRLAGAGHQVGLSEAKIMGLSAALSSVGIEAEAGGSAMSKVMVEMQLAAEKGGDSLSAFAKVAGMSSKDFQKAFKQDAAGALIAFIKGLQTSQDKGISAIKVLDDMGITEVRMRDALLRAAGAGDLFNKSIEIGTKAWKENTALQNEANQRYATTESQIKMTKNQIKDAAITIGNNLLPVIRDVATKIAEATEKFSKLSPQTQQSIIKFGALAIATGPLIWGLGKVFNTASLLAGGLGKLTGFLGRATVASAGLGTASSGLGAAAGVASKGLSAMGLAAKLGTVVLSPWGLGIAAAGAAAFGLHKVLSKEVVPSVDLFADKVEYSAKTVKTASGEIDREMTKTTTKISENTKKQVGAYMELDDKATKTLNNFYIKGTKITKDTSKEIAGTYTQMGTQIKQSMDKKYQEQLKDLQGFLKNSKGISAKEQQDMLKKLQESNNKKKGEVDVLEKQILATMSKASKDKRELTIEEKNQINACQDAMKNTAVKTLSDSEVEQKLILERLKDYGSRITAEQASEVIKNANKQRDESVKEAEKEYDERIKIAIRLREEGGEEGKKLADKIEAEAKRQKKESIDRAEELRNGVVEKIKGMNKSILENINITDGSIKTKWTKLKEFFSNNPIMRTIKTVMENSQKELEGGEQYATGTTNAKRGWNLVGEKGPELLWFGGGETVLNNKDTMALFDKLDSKIGYNTSKQWGLNLSQGLADGISSTRGLVFSEALNTADGINNKTRESLGIHSPSRVMAEIGKYINEGLGLGIEENKVIPLQAIADLGNTIWNDSKNWTSKYGKDVTKVLSDTIKNNSYEPEQAAKTITDKINNIVKQKQDDLKKELDKMNADSKAKVDALQKQLREVRNAETVNIRGTKKGTRYGIQDSYRSQKQAIEDKIKAVKDGCSKEVKAREEAVKKEIELIKKGGQQATEELRKESEARQKVVQNIDKLNDLIQKSLTRKIEKERDAALESAKIKAKEANLTKNQLDSLLSYTKEYYDKKLDRDKLQAVAEQLIMSKNQKAIVELLNNYGNLYEDSGTTLGQRMVYGMKSWTDMVPGIVGDAMGKVETSVQQTSLKVENTLSGIMGKIATVGKSLLGIGGISSSGFDNDIFSNWQSSWKDESKEEDAAKKIADKYKDAFNRIELAQIELGRETKNSYEELKKQQATLDIQKDKLSTLKNKYNEMRTALGASDDEVISLKKDIASLTIEIENQEQRLAVDSIRNKYNKQLEAIELSTLKLTRETKNFKEELELQSDLYINNVLKLNAMKAEYEELVKILGKDADEVKNLQKEIIDFQNNLDNFVRDTNNKVIDEINNFNNEVKEALKNKYNEELKLQEDKINKELDNLGKWKDESIKRVTDVYDAKIKALEEETKAEDRAEKDREELNKINKLKAAIEFEHSEFNKLEMQKELAKLIDERNKRLHKEEVEDKKEKLEEQKQNEISNINDLYEANKSNLEKQLEDTKKFYEDKLNMVNLQAEAERIIVRNNQDEIVLLLKSYSNKYEEAGTTLGEKLAEGMTNKINPVLDMIQSIEDRINSMKDAAVETAKYIQTDMIVVPSYPGAPRMATTNNNSSQVINNNNITFNSPKALTPSEQLRKTETTLRKFAFTV